MHHQDPVVAQNDPAVKDLQTLDKDQEVIANFAALDDDSGSDDSGATATE
jgi:hypothetical protein